MSLTPPSASSRYIRTSGLINSEAEIVFSDASRIRIFPQSEADVLSLEVEEHYVPVRISYEKKFYKERAQEFANRTVIEVFRPGDLAKMGPECEEAAGQLERVTLLASTLNTSKEDFQRRLGLDARQGSEFYFLSDADFRLSSRKQSTRDARGILVDKSFVNRFEKNGFHQLVTYLQSRTGLSEHVASSLNWLYESRIEPRFPASIVKTAIALETLMVFDRNEPLAQTLSERMAFILSPDPTIRQTLSRMLKKFYDARSIVVHGNRKDAKKLRPELLEAVDRLAVLCYLTLAANGPLWETVDSLRKWCESQRWGAPATDVTVPFSEKYLKSALTVMQEEKP